jgi:hypothetical protein
MKKADFYAILCDKVCYRLIHSTCVFGRNERKGHSCRLDSPKIGVTGQRFGRFYHLAGNQRLSKFRVGEGWVNS